MRTPFLKIEFDSVYYNNGKYETRVSIHNMRRYLGRYPTAWQAHQRVLRFKSGYLVDFALEQSDKTLQNKILDIAVIYDTKAMRGFFA